MKATARAVCAELGVELREIDITGDDGLEAQYRASLPVVEIDGQRAFKYHLDEGEFRRRLARAGA